MSAVAEVGVGGEALIVVVPEGGAVNLVRAGLYLQIDGGATGEALFGVEGVGDDVDSLQRFEGGIDGDDVGEIGIVAGGAINADVIGLIAGAIDGKAQAAGRVGREGVSVLRRGEAGESAKERLVVAAERNGRAFEGGFVDFAANFGAFRLKG